MWKTFLMICNFPRFAVCFLPQLMEGKLIPRQKTMLYVCMCVHIIHTHTHTHMQEQDNLLVLSLFQLLQYHTYWPWLEYRLYISLSDQVYPHVSKQPVKGVQKRHLESD